MTTKRERDSAVNQERERYRKTWQDVCKLVERTTNFQRGVISRRHATDGLWMDDPCALLGQLVLLSSRYDVHFRCAVRLKRSLRGELQLRNRLGVPKTPELFVLSLLECFSLTELQQWHAWEVRTMEDDYHDEKDLGHVWWSMYKRRMGIMTRPEQRHTKLVLYEHAEISGLEFWLVHELSIILPLTRLIWAYVGGAILRPYRELYKDHVEMFQLLPPLSASESHKAEESVSVAY